MNQIELLDHLEIVNWIQYSSYKCSIGKTITNFDERKFIELPSGKKIRITIKIEDI